MYTTNAGLYDEDGERTIYVPASSEASSLKPVNDDYYLRQDGEAGQTERKCRIRTMDTFCWEQGIEQLDFIKCDTEGAEKMVFSGASRVLSELQPMVYTEMLRKHAARFGYHPNEIIELFRGMGYNCYREEGCRLIPFDYMDEETVETNFFFLHRKRHCETIRRHVQ